MTPLEKAQKEAIIRRIAFAEIELTDLAAFRSIDYETYRKDRLKRRNIERIAENIANVIIDIGKIVLAGENIETPGTYREVFLRMHELEFITKEMADKLGDLARTRNILAHQYLDLKWEKLRTFTENAPAAVEEFIRVVSSLIDA